MDTKLSKTSRPGLLSNWFTRDPFYAIREDFDNMISRLTEDWNGNGGGEASVHLPSLNMSETDKELELTVELPGITAEEVDIELSGNNLRISGEHKEEKKEEKEDKGRRYHRIERKSGSFFRSIDLPCAVEESKITAECKNGVLTVKLPKSETAVTRKVKVKG